MSKPGKWQAWDFYGLCRRLVHAENSRMMPWDINRLTEPEMLLMLDADMTKHRPPTGSTPLQSHEEVLAYVEMWRKMTPEERLRRAMEDD